MRRGKVMLVSTKSAQVKQSLRILGVAAWPLIIAM
jgi:hypothetical protein